MIDPTVVAGQMEPEIIIIGTTTGNAIPSQSLHGFLARMVLVDNFSNQFVYIPQANTWVPPNTQGYRINIPNGTNVKQANVATTPTGAAQAATVAGQQIILTWLEKPVITSSVTQQITTINSTSIDGTLVNAAATITAVASGASTQQAIAATTSLRLIGWAVAETAAATARLVLYHGTTTTGTIIANIGLAASETTREFWGTDGIAVASGIFAEKRTGTLEFSLFTKVQA